MEKISINTLSSDTRKLIIIDGMDNTGKTTIINRLCKFFDDTNEVSYKVIKYDNPICTDSNNLDIDKVTNKYYHDKFIDIDNAYRNNTNIIILDRSWLSEYVYGQIYRHRNPLNIMTNILSIEYKLFSLYWSSQVYMITLISPSLDLLIKNDDAKSLSNCNIDLLKIEHQLFQEVYDMSLIPQKMLLDISKINHESLIYEFRDVLPDVLKFILYK